MKAFNFSIPKLLAFQSAFSPIRFMSSTSINPEIPKLLSFWFDHDEGMKRYFIKNETFDKACRTSYGDLVTQARNDKLEDWRSTADGSLALLILLDQIPRNIFRGSSESFSSDAKASEVAVDSIAKGFDTEVGNFRANFFYLPLMHGESMISQVASLGMYQGLQGRCNPDTEDIVTAKAAEQASRKHLAVIRRFGRFPARNKALGRGSTPEEEEFLRENPGGT